MLIVRYKVRRITISTENLVVVSTCVVKKYFKYYSFTTINDIIFISSYRRNDMDTKEDRRKATIFYLVPNARYIFFYL